MEREGQRISSCSFAPTTILLKLSAAHCSSRQCTWLLPVPYFSSWGPTCSSPPYLILATHLSPPPCPCHPISSSWSETCGWWVHLASVSHPCQVSWPSWTHLRCWLICLPADRSLTVECWKYSLVFFLKKEFCFIRWKDERGRSGSPDGRSRRLQWLHQLWRYNLTYSGGYSNSELIGLTMDNFWA